jgi:hypothetical protein
MSLDGLHIRLQSMMLALTQGLDVTSWTEDVAQQQPIFHTTFRAVSLDAVSQD